MKHFNSLKLISSFREMSNVLEIISQSIRLVTFLLVIIQALLLIRDAKNGATYKG